MKTIMYVVKEENVRNVEGDKEVIKNIISGIDPKEHISEIDFSEVQDPKVTMSTGLVFQEIEKAGFHKIVVKNHKYNDQLKANPFVNGIISKNKLEIY